MHAFTLPRPSRAVRPAGPGIELLSVRDLSFGLYVLAAGAGRAAAAHRGRGVRGARRAQPVTGDETAMRSRDVIFVPALVPHRFHDITEELRVVVVFGPAEGSRAS